MLEKKNFEAERAKYLNKIGKNIFLDAQVYALVSPRRHWGEGLTTTVLRQKILDFYKTIRKKRKVAESSISSAVSRLNYFLLGEVYIISRAKTPVGNKKLEYRWFNIKDNDDYKFTKDRLNGKEISVSINRQRLQKHMEIMERRIAGIKVQNQ